MVGPSLTRRGLVAAVVVLLAPACTSDDTPDDAAAEEAEIPVPSVTVPPERLTPFCQGMIELADRIETDPPDDVDALIVSTYEELTDEVPDEIATEFAAVLDGLRGGDGPGPATTPEPTAAPLTTDAAGEPVPLDGDPLPDEGFLPDDDPARRVNAYVQFACRDTANNPGPPATQPLDDIAPDDTSVG